MRQTGTMRRYALVFAAIAAIVGSVRGESELVIAIRYLQAQGASHSHLFLYSEDGKLLRQITNDNSGQDLAPIFSPDGETMFSLGKNLTTCANSGVLVRAAQI